MNNEEPETPKPKKPEPLMQRKVFDVMPPGKAPAPANSRGVIVGHKKQVKEDMFVDSGHARMAGDPGEKRDLMTTSDKVSINPLSSDLEASAPPVGAKHASPPAGSEPETDEPSVPAATSPQQEPTAPEETATAPLLDTTATAPAAPVEEPTSKDAGLTPEQAATNRAMENPPTVETPQEIWDNAVRAEDGSSMSGEDLLAGTHAPSLDQTIVSHHKHKTRWWEWLIIFLTIVAVAIVALNFLLDAEVVTTDVDVPHTNLIK